jgi:hypothetical protein
LFENILEGERVGRILGDIHMTTPRFTPLDSPEVYPIFGTFIQVLLNIPNILDWL